MRTIQRAAAGAPHVLVLFLMLAWCCCALPARADSNGDTVAGTIVASDGTPIGGARIELASQTTSASSISDSKGEFTFRGVAAGIYAVSASAPGYASLVGRTLTVAPGERTSLALVLARATNSSLAIIGDVHTQAGATVSTSSAVVSTVNAQAAAAAGTASVSDMLFNQLSTTPVLPLGGGSNATVSYAVRGPDPTETLVDIDGHQVNNGNTGDFDVSLVDPAALQDVQVVYGISPSSLIGPNTIGGAVNIQTLQPTPTDHTFLRVFAGMYGEAGETIQSTGSSGAFGYAVSLHRMTSSGDVNTSVLDSASNTVQPEGSAYFGESLLTKVRYTIGGSGGFGYVQLDLRDSAINKDLSATLTNYTPGPGGGYQSFSGSWLGSHQANYGLDAQIPIGAQLVDGAPATIVQFSHLTTLASQSVDGPALDTQPYLYNQRDLLSDDWLQIDHTFAKGTLSFKYDLGNEALNTDYVVGQITAEGGVGAPASQPGRAQPSDDSGGSGGFYVLPLAQTQRYGVIRYTGDPSTHIHISVAGYFSDFSAWGTSFNPRAGIVWTPTGSTAVRASFGTTFQTPQLSELVALPDVPPIGGVIYTGNPNLKPDNASEYDLGGEQIFGKSGSQLRLSGDLYWTNMRSPSNQLVVNPGSPNCSTPGNPACPESIPVNAGNGVYSGAELRVERQLGANDVVRVGWSENSSYLTVIPASIQDGTLVPYEQSLGQPLHKAYLEFERTMTTGLGYGADLEYHGTYNELNLAPYATLNAHVVYRANGYTIGLFGTNLTNVYANQFTVINGGVPYGAEPGQPLTATDAYILPSRNVIVVVSKDI